LAQILQRGTATRRDRQQGPDHADEIRGRHQPVTLSEAGKLCLRAVQGWGSDHDYNNVRPHSSLGNKTPAKARRALELLDGTAPGALATPENDDYQNQGLSL
jgi:transposase InsO family protein